MKHDARTYLGTDHACVDQTLSIVVRRGTSKDCLVVHPNYLFLKELEELVDTKFGGFVQV